MRHGPKEFKIFPSFVNKNLFHFHNSKFTICVASDGLHSNRLHTGWPDAVPDPVREGLHHVHRRWCWQVSERTSFVKVARHLTIPPTTTSIGDSVAAGSVCDRGSINNEYACERSLVTVSTKASSSGSPTWSSSATGTKSTSVSGTSTTAGSIANKLDSAEPIPSHYSSAVIAVAVVGGLLGLGVCAVLTFCWYRRKKRQDDGAVSNPEMHAVRDGGFTDTGSEGFLTANMGPFAKAQKGKGIQVVNSTQVSPEAFISSLSELDATSRESLVQQIHTYNRKQLDNMSEAGSPASAGSNALNRSVSSATTVTDEKLQPLPPLEKGAPTPEPPVRSKKFGIIRPVQVPPFLVAAEQQETDQQPASLQAQSTQSLRRGLNRVQLLQSNNSDHVETASSMTSIRSKYATPNTSDGEIFDAHMQVDSRSVSSLNGTGESMAPMTDRPEFYSAYSLLHSETSEDISSAVTTASAGNLNQTRRLDSQASLSKRRPSEASVLNSAPASPSLIRKPTATRATHAATRAFHASRPDEISLAPGDLLQLLDQVEDGRIRVKNLSRDKAIGIVRANCVGVLEGGAVSMSRMFSDADISKDGEVDGGTHSS
ncbi:hypothetical protein BJ741DRAFT_269754 [Chytriomyces cf. hyalinus JEL632]|nr:hypothetical protein BJ741DRAFT_269754 [Chytriomyces cf. hyalinus JEL632]